MERFTHKDADDWEIFKDGKHFAYAHSGYQAEKIIDKLNEQSERIIGLEDLVKCKDDEIKELRDSIEELELRLSIAQGRETDLW